MAMSYVSEITQFINQYKKDHPHAEEQQRKGRARLWDKKLNPEQLEQFKKARVPQQPYVYQTK